MWRTLATCSEIFWAECFSVGRSFCVCPMTHTESPVGTEAFSRGVPEDVSKIRTSVTYWNVSQEGQSTRLDSWLRRTVEKIVRNRSISSFS